MAVAARAVDDRFTDPIMVMNEGFAGAKQNIGLVKWFIVRSFTVSGAAISPAASLQQARSLTWKRELSMATRITVIGDSS